MAGTAYRTNREWVRDLAAVSRKTANRLRRGRKTFMRRGQTMAEYIEREALLEITEQQGHVDVDDILGSPAADVAPVRHGRWSKDGRCTVCGGHAPYWAMSSAYYKSPFCFECGARMDEEAEHGTTDI